MVNEKNRILEWWNSIELEGIDVIEYKLFSRAKEIGSQTNQEVPIWVVLIIGRQQPAQNNGHHYIVSRLMMRIKPAQTNDYNTANQVDQVCVCVCSRWGR